MDQNDDSIFPEAGHLNGTSEGGTTGSTGVSDTPVAERAAEGVATGLRPGFLAELAVAMRATAQKERERIAARVADDAAAHIEKVRARAAIETDELKRLAEEDVQHIEDWSAAEMERIRGEADRKIEDRRSSLEEYLQQHDTIIDTEIDGVSDAVNEYSATLDRYFEELSRSEDPSTIVARAEALPAPPDLDQVRAQARARAVAAFAAADEPPSTPAAAEGTAVAEAPAEREPAPALADTAMSPEATVGAIVSDPAEAIQDNTAAEPAASEGAGAIAESRSIDDRASLAQAAMAGAAMSEPVTAGAPTVETPTVETPTVETPTVDERVSESAPIPVMDPTATADSTWPAPEAAPEREPEPVAAAVDHQSAAVRLLRSVAPWTAPTHAGSNDRSESD